MSNQLGVLKTTDVLSPNNNCVRGSINTNCSDGDKDDRMEDSNTRRTTPPALIISRRTPSKKKTMVSIPPPSAESFSLRSSSACSEAFNNSTLGESSKTCLSVSSQNETLMQTEVTSIKTSMRIRVINEISNRFKDLLVPIQNDLTLFEAVYENKSVKAAHVRKWGPQIVQKVKSNQAELQCAVWDDVVESPCHTFTVDELREMSTRQLYQLVPESDLIKLVLRCVDVSTHKTEDAFQQQKQPEPPHSDPAVEIAAIAVHDVNVHSASCVRLTEAELHSPAPAMSSPKQCKKVESLAMDLIKPLNEQGNEEEEPVTLKVRSKAAITAATARTASPSRLSQHSHRSTDTNGVFRCPFSGISVDESIFQDFESQIARQKSHSQLDNLSSDYQNSLVGTRSVNTTSEASSVGGSDRLYNFQSRRRNRSPSTGNASTTLRQPSPHRPTTHHDVCDSLSSGAADESDTFTIWSNEEVVPGDVAKTTMRVRISNAISKRFKDLVVDIDADACLFDTVYENKAVKSAHVRKWGPEVVNDVKKKVAELKCLVLDGVEGDVCRTFSMEDLKKTSTKDLFELVPASDPVYLVLTCVKNAVTKSLVETVHKRMALDNPKISLVLEKGMPQARTVSKTSLTMSRSEPCFPGGLKRSSRPNHMNLSAMRNATFIPGGVPSSKPNHRHTMNHLSGVSSLGSSASSMESSYHSKPPLRRGRRKNISIKSQDVTIDSKFPSWHGASESFSSGNGQLEDFDQQTVNVGLSTGPLVDVAFSMESIDLMLLLEEKKQDRDESDTCNIDFVTEKSNISSSSSKGDDKKPSLEDRENREKQIKEFMRLCRSKKGREYQSSDNIWKKKMSDNVDRSNGAQNATFPSPTPAMTSLSSGQPSLIKEDLLKATAVDCKTSPKASFKVISKPPTDRINRFLQFSEARKLPGEDTPTENGPILSQVNGSVTSSSQIRNNNDEPSLTTSGKEPPIAEIAVITGGQCLDSGPVAFPSISLSGDVVKDVFPYHIVLNEDFHILQVGNSLSLLMDSCSLLGRCVSDVARITGPIPTLGKWDWSTMDKMKDNTVWLESIECNSTNQKAKFKGTIIELSKQPRRVMLALFPNVKNLSELESMNLSMADLPLHSCQREAVLLGEHSKSEVKLTNHLDQLHRELINSMEKQIEDRTNELATANRELEDANERLAIQSARQLEHFACMSHEIRTPLNCIVGMSSLLLEETEEDCVMDPMHADSIRMINTSGELLRAVVDDVLDYAKLESGSFLVDIKPTKLQHTLDSVVHSISQKVQEKNIRLRTHYSPTLPEILETDSRRLQQVLFNLLGNAGKFSHNNSVIDLTVSVVKSELNPGCEIIRFAVKDYGKGIDAKDFETIFQPFSQASKETQNVYGGTGLGLSITSKLVNRLGGTIAVDSEPEKYAQFTVDLPMNGEPVDVKRISNSLAGILIILVEPKRQYDYSFTSFPIKDEPHPLCPAVADVYGLHVIRCHTLAEAYSHLSKKSGVEQTDLVLLVHEQLYHNTLHESLNALIGESNYTLMTHGPNYLVERTKNCHFKNLSGIFPVTLLDSIACHVQNQKMKNQSNITDYPNNVSCAATSNNLFSALSKPAIDQSISQLSIPTITPPSAIGSTDKSNSVVCNKKCPNTDLSAQISSLSSQTPLSPSLAAGKKASPKLHIKVLYAEDNIVNQKVLSRVLNRTGITDITVVDDGKKAVDVSAREKFDCIFMDMQMPVMDGMEATKIIMARDPNAKVIFVTAHALDEFKSKAESVGAASFISKPFRVSDIEKVLQVIGLTSRSEYTKTNEDEKLEELKQNAHPQVLVLKSEYVDKHEDTSQNKSIAMPPPPPVPLTPSPFVTDRKEAVPQRHLKVLYAEDNLINQKVLSRVLNRSGIFDITIVDNGKKAVDICAATNFDCIFMDYEMPIMDGMEATKIIMEHDRGAKVIFVTAHVLEEYKNKAMSLGATDFLAKPVRICDIEAVLQRLGL